MTIARTGLTVAVAGAAGRMGRQIAALAIDQGWRVAGGTESPGSGAFGEDIGVLAGRSPAGVKPVADAAQAAAAAEVWIDFTQPGATLAALSALAATPVRAVVIGTTGFTPEQEKAIESAAARFAIVKSGNFSVGINLIEALVRLAASRLGPAWDIEVLEAHHRLKLDAPSGTARMLAQAAADGRGVPLEGHVAPPYLGPHAPRTEGAIGMAVRRGGGIYGEHEVLFASMGEVLRVSHTALNREVFAEGAMRAAAWAAGQAPGLYGMDDVLGLGHTG